MSYEMCDILIDIIISFHFEDFMLKNPLLFEICARETCEKFVYKHSETRIC